VQREQFHISYIFDPQWCEAYPSRVRKLRILLAEVVGLGVLIGWLLWKYPELVDDIIPWVALLIAWHVTWEYVLDTEWVRRGAAAVGRRLNPLIAWPLVFVLGGAISLFYWVGITRSLSGLAATATRLAAAKANQTTSGHEPTLKTEAARPHERTAPPKTAPAPPRPISKALRFSTIVPFTAANANVPIPLNSNNEDPKADFYGDLTGLAGRPNEPPEGTVYGERNFNDEGYRFIFVTRLIQYYVLHSLRVLQGGRQGTRWIAGKGVTAIDVPPITAPDAAPYSTDALLHALGDNEFLNRSDTLLWKARPFQPPRGTIIKLGEQQPSDRPFECSVQFERPGYYRIDLVVSPGPALSAQLPAGFQTPTPNVDSYNMTVAMNYEVQKRTDDGFEPEAYVAWAESLFSGLKNIMAP
jgi:hypothetical protein